MTAAEQTADDNSCLHISDGHKWSFIAAALAKRTLQIPGIKPSDRLALLEKLNATTDDWFTADMLAGIEPMCDTAAAIVHEARSLDPPQDDTHCAASFKVLATPQVFDHFVKLNPSIMAAIKQRAAGRQDHEPPPTETPPPRPQTVMGAAQFAAYARRSNGAPPPQHRSHFPAGDQINRMGGDLPDWTYDAEKDSA
jgi:hypothetical protein